MQADTLVLPVPPFQLLRVVNIALSVGNRQVYSEVMDFALRKDGKLIQSDHNTLEAAL